MAEHSIMSPIDQVRLRHAEFIAKESYLTGTISRLGVMIVDDLQECVFCQILRVGKGIRDPENIAPGKVIVIHKTAGKYMKSLSKDLRLPHFVIHETDVVACITN